MFGKSVSDDKLIIMSMTKTSPYLYNSQCLGCRGLINGPIVEGWSPSDYPSIGLATRQGLTFNKKAIFR